MKVSLNYILLLVCTFSFFFMPVAAITTGTGNTTYVQPTGPIQSSPPTALPTTYSTFVPPVDISQNVGVVPIWLIVGIILIIIALSGLLWRYFHPKYVAPEEHD